MFWPTDENISSSWEDSCKSLPFLFFSLDSGEQICIIVALLDILIFEPKHLKAQMTFFVMVGIDLDGVVTYNLSKVQITLAGKSV